MIKGKFLVSDELITRFKDSKKVIEMHGSMRHMYHSISLNSAQSIEWSICRIDIDMNLAYTLDSVQFKEYLLNLMVAKFDSVIWMPILGLPKKFPEYELNFLDNIWVKRDKHIQSIIYSIW